MEALCPPNVRHLIQFVFMVASESACVLCSG